MADNTRHSPDVCIGAVVHYRLTAIDVRKLNELGRNHNVRPGEFFPAIITRLLPTGVNLTVFADNDGSPLHQFGAIYGEENGQWRLPYAAE